MIFTIGDTKYVFERLAHLAAANSFPDISFFAGGKVNAAGKTGRIRLTLGIGNQTLKRWTERVEFLSVDGTPLGNMFKGYLLEKDDIDGGFVFKCEIDSGSGYKEVQPTDAPYFEYGALQGLAATFDSGNGVIATFGFVITA